MVWGLYTTTYLLLAIFRRCSKALPTLHKTRIHCFPPAGPGTAQPFQQPRMEPQSYRYVFSGHCASFLHEPAVIADITADLSFPSIIGWVELPITAGSGFQPIVKRHHCRLSEFLRIPAVMTPAVKAQI
jgi:hypothetical protein